MRGEGCLEFLHLSEGFVADAEALGNLVGAAVLASASWPNMFRSTLMTVFSSAMMNSFPAMCSHNVMNISSVRFDVRLDKQTNIIS